MQTYMYLDINCGNLDELLLYQSSSFPLHCSPDGFELYYALFILQKMCGISSIRIQETCVFRVIYFADMSRDTKTGFKTSSNAFVKWEMR